MSGGLLAEFIVTDTIQLESVMKAMTTITTRMNEKTMEQKGRMTGEEEATKGGTRGWLTRLVIVSQIRIKRATNMFCQLLNVCVFVRLCKLINRVCTRHDVAAGVSCVCGTHIHCVCER